MRIMENLVKGRWSRRSDVPLLWGDDADDWVPAAPEPPSPAGVEVDVARYLAAIETLGTDPVHVSAAITVVYLKAHDRITVDDAPWPKAGVTNERRETWPALWIATRDPGLFPNPQRRRPDGQARKRQRLLEQINRLLTDLQFHLRAEGAR
jgi:hypothetical protein